MRSVATCRSLSWIADSGTAGDDHHLAGEGKSQSITLGIRERQSRLPLDPGYGLLRDNSSPRRLAPEQAQHTGGSTGFRSMQRGQKQAELPANVFLNQILSCNLGMDRLLDDWRRNFEQLDGGLDQSIPGRRTMPIRGNLLQNVPDPRLSTNQRIGCDTELHSQGVSRLEADAVDVQRQAIRIFRDLDDGVKWGPIPLTIPESRYFSMPSRVLGGTTLS